MFSIRFKVTAISVLVIVIIVFSVFGASYITLQTENDQRSVEVMNLIGQNTKQSLEKYTESVEQSVEMLANIATDSLDAVFLIENGAAGTYISPQAQTEEQRKRIDGYFEEHCDNIRLAFSSVAGRTHGVVSYYYCINPEICRSNCGFFYSRAGRAGFEEKENLDIQNLDPDDRMHNAWYFTPVDRGRPSWVGPYKDSYLDERWCCSYTVPIYKSGTLIGVLGMDIPFETLARQVSPIRVFQTGFASLLDEDGRVLYHPEYEIFSEPDFSDLFLKSDLLQENSSGNELIRYTVDGQRRQMSFTTLSNGMKLVIVAPEAEINASWIRLIRITLIIALVAVVVCLLLLLIVMRYLTRPLQRLTVASHRLAEGDYDTVLDYQGKDEFGELTQSFKSMRDQLKHYIENLNHRVLTNSLTDMPNMRYFFTLAEKENNQLLKEGKQPVMVYFNLSGIKHFNRQYGFEEGDKLICAFAEILADNFGREKMCHIALDHFAAVSERSSVEEILQQVFLESQQINDGVTLPVRAGIYPENQEEMNINIALDRAKYACDKLRGSFVSGFNYFDDEMMKEEENVRYITTHLNQALEEKWIRVFYQPIIRSSDGKIGDVEALARWFDPERGMLPPGDFIPILEKASLIYRLDLYILDSILENMKIQKESGVEIVPHSLNLSRSDFECCDIVEEIRRRVDASGFSRDLLTIEITESIIGKDFDFMKGEVFRFRELGFKVWMDDFGSGYSSLDVLQEIRFDVIKFDMRFLRRFDESRESRIILKELTEMTILLNIETVCEGVETEEQAAFLKEIGCTRLQGFYFSRPVPLEELIRLLNDDQKTII